MPLLTPEQASTVAREVDAFYFFMIVSTGTLAAAVVALIVVFAVRYRRRRPDEVGAHVTGSVALEIGWTLATFGLFMLMFAWSAVLFVRLSRPPADAIDVFVVARQWMWKFQHVAGQREINELHVPVGRAVRLTMAAEDVIHSFFVPAFRVKNDVIPGRYTTAWFEATKPGSYHLFCAEYCGTKHSGMIGKVVVMEPARFQEWLGGGVEGSLAAQGERLFQSLGCRTCHRPDAQARGPDLTGLFGSTVTLSDGRQVTADEAYLRESIVEPNAKLVQGFQANVMPVYRGQLDEEALVQLVAYLRSLQGKKGREPR